MRDRTLFPRLKALFSTDVVIRNVGGKSLKVMDPEQLTAFGHLQTNSIVDRFTRLHRSSQRMQYNPTLNYQTMRIQLYTDYEAMDTEPVIASALDVMAAEATLKSDLGDILSIRSTDDNVQRELENLFYNTLNIEFTLPIWIRSMCKYGDFFLKLDIVEKYGVTGTKPLSVYDIIREEGMDPNNQSYIRYVYDPLSVMGGTAGTRDKQTFENYEIAHFRYLVDTNFLPFGRSILEPARKIWKQYCLKYDSKIWTPTGYTEIKDIKQGDTVLSYNSDGELIHAKVLNKVYTGNKPVYEIRTGHRKVYATEDHPFMTSEGIYKRVKDLTEEDYLITPYVVSDSENIIYPELTLPESKHHVKIKKNNEDFLLSKIDDYNSDNKIECEVCGIPVKRLNGIHLKKHSLTPTTYREKYNVRTTPYILDKFLTGERILETSEANDYINDLNIPTELIEYYDFAGKTPIIDEKLLKDNFIMYVRFFGFMLGDGWISKNNVYFSMGNRLDKSSKYVDFINSLELNHKVHKQESTKSYCSVYSNYLSKLLQHHGFITETKNKIIPEWIFSLPNEYIYEFIQGFIDADGCVVKNGQQLAGINKKLIEDLAILSQRIGLSVTNVVCTRSGSYNKDNNSKCYSFIIREKSRNRWKHKGDSFFERILSITECGNEDVYDIEIDNENHNFIADGVVVHNCMIKDAMLLHRIMRAPEKRVFYIDVAGLPPNEVDAHMQKIANQMKKTPFVNPDNGDYNLKFNVQNMLEDFYIPTRGNTISTKIDTTKGLEYAGIEDVQFLLNELLAAIKVPKSFLNYSDELNGKSTLAGLSLIYSITLEHIQRIMISELYKIALVHLYVVGYDDSDLTNFRLSLTSPSILYEQEKISLLKEKVELAANIMEKKVFSTNWIYENIFNMSEDQYNEQRELIIEDIKRQFRLSQIENEGNDPAISGVSYGTKHDLATIYKAHAEGDQDVPDGYDEKQNPVGRPKEKVSAFGTDNHYLGRDPLGVNSLKGDAKMKTDRIRPNMRGGSLALEGLDKFRAKKINLFEEKVQIEDIESGMLNEENILKDNEI